MQVLFLEGSSLVQRRRENLLLPGIRERIVHGLFTGVLAGIAAM
jgi:hypothetical protein